MVFVIAKLAPAPHVEPHPDFLPVDTNVDGSARTSVCPYAPPPFAKIAKRSPTGSPAVRLMFVAFASVSPPNERIRPKSVYPSSSPRTWLNLPPKYAFHALSLRSQLNTLEQSFLKCDCPALAPT